MAESFSRWESDPLFSAAEVVQDSADRMETVFRLFLHEQELMQGDHSDTKLLSSMQYHKRDLFTALETTRWQLEDFERAVNLATLSDKSNSRENAISKFRQFIRAIKEQIFQVESCVGNSSLADSSRSSHSKNSAEHDTDGLALFLSGRDTWHNHVCYESGNNIMSRFLDSSTNSNEIIELKTEEIPSMNGLKHPDGSYDPSKDCIPQNVEAHYPKRDLVEPILCHGSSRKDEYKEEYAATEAHDLESGDSGAKCYPHNNRLNRPYWRFLRNFWLVRKSRESFTKRRKDGEVADVDEDRRLLPSNFSVPSAEWNMCFWMDWVPRFRICQRSRHVESIVSVQFYVWLESVWRRSQRYQYFFLINQFRIQFATTILVALAVLGFLVFHIA
ncbi:uncharacterized protein [Typha latifolia]|uniref:uncharacterized protein n=1 Tax=Typha latifolia TaxID=4733 RepID=UPI003C2FF78B